MLTLLHPRVLVNLERRRKVEMIPIFLEYLKLSGIKTTWEDFIDTIRTLQSSK